MTTQPTATTAASDSPPTRQHRRTEPAEFPATIVVRSLVDPLIDRVGIAVTAPYVEALWLATVGPSSVWLLRKLDGHLAVDPDGVELRLIDLAEAIGLGYRTGRWSPIQHTIRRLIRFGLADWTGELHARRFLAPLTDRQLARLSPALQQQHDVLLSAHHTNCTSS